MSWVVPGAIARVCATLDELSGIMIRESDAQHLLNVAVTIVAVEDERVYVQEIPPKFSQLNQYDWWLRREMLQPRTKGKTRRWH